MDSHCLDLILDPPFSPVRIEAVSSSVPLFSSLENGAINSTELIRLLWASNELSTKSSMH